MLGYHIVNDSSYNPRDLSSLMKDLVDDSVYDAAVERMIQRDRTRKSAVANAGEDRTYGEMSEAEWMANVSEKHGASDQCIVCELNKSSFFREAFRFQDRYEQTWVTKVSFTIAVSFFFSQDVHVPARVALHGW